ncbi:MAG TPA: alpha/beta fold hydrolase [Holophagaceae bacterium]|jgi:alpha-beta hydrolase superfamily lysophospholipase|nr:alpha/beta fold hydrolase [Holophagaceae bacterium]
MSGQARKRAVLVHGMGHTPLSMLLLAARLRSRGVDCETFGYFAGAASFEDIAAKLAERLARQPGEYVAMGHSLGGLLLREAISRLPDTAPKPIHPSLSARHAQPPFAPGRAAKAFAPLPPSDRRQRPAAGRRQPHGGHRASGCPYNCRGRDRQARQSKGPFGEELNDGVVALSEAHLPGAALKALPLLHTFLMNSARVADFIAPIS